jgi:hypothetical protein
MSGLADVDLRNPKDFVALERIGFPLQNVERGIRGRRRGSDVGEFLKALSPGRRQE